MASEALKYSMRLFGIPYQFRPEVDPRVKSVSTKVGRKFIQNILVESPKITIIPGRPKYLPGTSKDAKNTTTAALLQNASSNFRSLKSYIGKASQDEVRYYDFARSYTEYMKYVNILCRACATFLDINDKIDGVSMQRYDWRNYRQNASSYKSTTSKLLDKSVSGITKKFNDLLKPSTSQQSKSAKNTDHEFLYETTSATEETDENEEKFEDVLASSNYVQFYVDPDVSSSESMANATTESKLKGMMDTGSDIMKELAFIANSGGFNTDELQQFGDESVQSLSDYIGRLGNGSATTAISRILSVSSNVIKGENVIIPDIYQSSSYDKSYSFTVHLKTPYGTKFGYFLNIAVPLMHLLALAIPKQTTANTYGAPFLVKMDVPGVFSCNMGIVSQIAINKSVSPESWTIDGLPNEVDVTVTVTDLYSDLSMSPQSSPLLFVNNSSLIEYLAVTCGLSVTSPQLSKKAELILNTTSNAIKDVPVTVGSYVTEFIDNTIADWTGLTW